MIDTVDQEDAAAKTPATKKTPGKMRTVIGNWKPDPNDETRRGFIVKADLGEGATGKDVTAAVKKLGTGTYDVLVYRGSNITYAKVEKDVIS